MSFLTKKPPTLAWTVGANAGEAFAYGMTMTENCEVIREKGYRIATDGRQSPRERELPCPRMTESHLSPQAYDRLRQELEERSTTRRREISHWIERAREHGDISENADYDAAKNEQGHNEARIRQLEAMLKEAVVIEATASGDTVEPGTLVELRYQGDDDVTTYLVGSIEERHETYDVLSTNSPLGQAILGKQPGSTVTYQGPKRELSVTIVGVRSLDG
jgi:transcription elongation factor GreA